MDDNAPKENPPADLDAASRRPDAGQPAADSGGAVQSPFNKIDLSQLQGFSFGTQWTQDKAGAQDGRERSDAQPRREDRRDRRSFRRPDDAGGPGRGDRGPSDPSRRGGAAAGPGPEGRREFSGDRRARPEFRGARSGDERGAPPSARDRIPYDSPFYSITFYPEDTSFNALVKTIRASCRTIELFEIARTVLGKAERFTVLMAPKDSSAPSRQGPGERPGQARAGRADEAPVVREDAARPDGTEPAGTVPARPVFYLSVADGLPFETEEAAVAHALSRHLSLYFDAAEVEVDPPKGNFQVVNRCGVTGELLGPPNYHRYSQIVQQHYAARDLRMPFEAYRARIESVRDPEAIAKWLEKMKRIVRYTWKEPEAPAPAPETEAPKKSFESLEEARVFLLTHAREKVVRPASQARFHGREAENLPPGEIRMAIEGALERQRRFPLDTANALRGRLRREHFTIFKKGAKGVSYVCAVKRKFRVPGQSFAESIGSLISHIEAHPMIKAGDLVKHHLGVSEAPAEAAARTDAPPAAAEGGAPAQEGAGTAGNPLPPEQREKIARMHADLLWLVREGYVTEFIDGSLYAAPAMVEARKREVEGSENDPENFPEAQSGAGEPQAESAGAPSDAPEAAKDPAPQEDAPPPETAQPVESGVLPPSPETPAPAAEQDSPPPGPAPLP